MNVEELDYSIQLIADKAFSPVADLSASPNTEVFKWYSVLSDWSDSFAGSSQRPLRHTQDSPHFKT